MKPRGLIIALVASLALNLFLAGLIVGGAVVARRMAELRPAVGGQARTPLWRAGDALPQPQRRAFRQAIRQAAASTQDQIREGRGLRRDSIAMLEQPTFDAAAARAGMDRARRIDGEARSQLDGAILEFAATLTPEQRLVLAAGLRQAMAGQLRDPPARGANTQR